MRTFISCVGGIPGFLGAAKEKKNSAGERDVQVNLAYRYQDLTLD